MVLRWKKEEEKLKTAHSKARKIGTGCHPHYPDVEIVLKQWILELRQNAFCVTANNVKTQMKYLLENEFNEKYPNSNSFEGHKTESVKNTYKELNCIPAIIPGGLTSIVQPLDVCLNKPFKDNLRKKWNTWIMNEVTLTKDRNLKKPPYKLICEWILQAWEEIPSQMVWVFRSRFRKHDTVRNSFSDLNISWQQIQVLQFLIDAEAGSRFGKHGTIGMVSAICQYFMATGLDLGNMALSEWF
ncbi:4526_t:CDS:2 [Acaulospora morrowiae]|uniref:4526_t:CDS:1 n=1 Tax=Acaulospora morrowiae TaxID=94023 RepID=A0A9N9GHH3_9GLOM|nr:4526_t:CDS:2 [Acaulospora morrowiae]